MSRDRYIILTAAFDPDHPFERSLLRVAPELSHVLRLIEDRVEEPRPSRTWAGIVDGRTFERFAAAWRLPEQTRQTVPARGRHAFTLDGMNWETDGESPITYVTVQIAPPAAAPTRYRRSASVSARDRARARAQPQRTPRRARLTSAKCSLEVPLAG